MGVAPKGSGRSKEKPRPRAGAGRKERYGQDEFEGAVTLGCSLMLTAA